jgi:hypothetical protein
MSRDALGDAPQPSRQAVDPGGLTLDDGPQPSTRSVFAATLCATARMSERSSPATTPT